MLGIEMALAIAEIKRLDYDRQQIEANRQSMSPEAFNAWLDAKMKFETEQRKEAVIERRHQELCRAIKGSSFWRFGGY